MNKKAYIAPALQIVLVQTQQMIAASGELALTISNDEETEGWADSRKHTSIWGDDDE